MKVYILHILFAISCMIPNLLLSRPVDTFYGTFEVHEPVLLELIDSIPMQRLKYVRQYGVCYYTSYPEELDRFDHSLGVFALLRKADRPLKEQIAGLLHDVSHTIFSHVGDWIYQKEHQEIDYQNSIHTHFLHQSGLADILTKYGYQTDTLKPTHESFPALESPLPTLCADRIDYNIQGAYHQGFLTKEEALALFHDLTFQDGQWVATEQELMKKLMHFSIYMSQHCWGSYLNSFEAECLSQAIIRLYMLGDVSIHTIHHGKDHEVWHQLTTHHDPVIQKLITLLLHAKEHCKLTSFAQADKIYITKFRGIDPLIATKQGVFPLSQLDAEMQHMFTQHQQLHAQGWPVAFYDLPWTDAPSPHLLTEHRY